MMYRFCVYFTDQTKQIRSRGNGLDRLFFLPILDEGGAEPQAEQIHRVNRAMKNITDNSRLTLEFTVEWQSGGVQYRDSLWADQVNMWRDCFSPELFTALMDREKGESVSLTVGPEIFSQPYNRNKVVSVRPDSFYSQGKAGTPMIPVTGRFYPQGFLHGVAHVFSNSIKPARYLGEDEHRLVFDLNHPLAAQSLTLAADVIEINPNAKERGGRCEDWLERVCDDGPGMQARYRDIATDFFIPAGMKRADETDDQRFYQKPRMVHHLDSTARATISNQYGTLVAPGSKILDLMGSWDSHLPPGLDLHSLTVLGMNTEELSANNRATERVIQDLNRNPMLLFDDESFDAIVCTASIEYLTDPLTVFSEMRRVLTPGGIVALAFSNRWFPPKAVKIWTELHEFERLGMILEMFHRTSGLVASGAMTRRGLPRPEDDPHQELRFSDPVFMAWGKKE